MKHDKEICKRIGSIILILILMLILFYVATNTNTQDRVAKLMDTAWQTTVADAKQDSLRRQEVTAKKSSISYYDFESDDIESLEMDVCSITDGSYTMKYIMQVIGEPDENGLYPLYNFGIIF